MQTNAFAASAKDSTKNTQTSATDKNLKNKNTATNAAVASTDKSKVSDKKEKTNDALTAVSSASNEETSDSQLKSALEYVYQNHPQIKAKREALKAVDESVAQAISGFRPDIAAHLSRGRERNADANQTWNYDDSRSKDLTVTQPIFSGGGTIASFMTAKERVKAARADLSATEQQVLFNAVLAYTDVVEKQSVLELNQKNVDVLKKQLDATNARFKVGELTVTDVSQSTARLARAQSDERQALGDLDVARATFKRAIGYDVDGKAVMPPVPAGIPANFAEAKEIAQSNNPILEAARRNENAAENNVYVRGATLLPSVNLQGSMVRADSSRATALGSLDSDSVKVNVTIPLYQSGAEWSRLREARNLAQQAKFNTMDTNESVIENVNVAWEAYNTSKAIIVSNKAALDAAETALNGVRKENEFGVRTVLDVLDAEQETFSTRVNLIKAVRTEKLQAYRLLAAIGKLTSKDLSLKTEIENPKEHYNNVKYQLLGL